MVNPNDIKNLIKPNAPKFTSEAVGNVGYDNPRENIDPNLKVQVVQTKEFIMNTNATNGYILSTDANGRASWVAPGAGSGDNLGNHIATQTISGSNIFMSAGIIAGSYNEEVIDHDSLLNTHNLTTDIDHNTLTNTHNLTTDIDHDALTNFVANEHIDWTNATVNLNTSGNVSGTNIINLSGAHWTLQANHVNLSGAHYTLQNNHVNLSGAYYTHAADTTDPHGATLTQTNIIGTSIVSSTISGGTAYASTILSAGRMAVLGDVTISGSAYVPMVLYGTDVTPPTASNYPIGSIYVQYS